jgi:hypothetical protein
MPFVRVPSEGGGIRMSDPELVEWDIKRLYERIDELSNLNRIQDQCLDALEERLELLEAKVEEMDKIE